MNGGMSCTVVFQSQFLVLPEYRNSIIAQATILRVGRTRVLIIESCTYPRVLLHFNTISRTKATTAFHLAHRWGPVCAHLIKHGTRRSVISESNLQLNQFPRGIIIAVQNWSIPGPATGKFGPTLFPLFSPRR